MDSVTVKQSKLSGQGLFAAKRFKKDEQVLKVKGKVLNLKQFFALAPKRRYNTYRLGENEFLDPDGTAGKFVNHSCEPNTKVVKKGKGLYLIALKDIPVNKEVFFDYSTVLAKDDYWIMKCACESKNCRGKIKRYTLLPSKTLTKYIQKKIIPTYIISI